MLVLQNVLQSGGCSSRTGEILQGRANRTTGRNLSDSRAPACTWKLHGFRWELLEPRLCHLHFRGVVAHGTRRYPDPDNFILDDLQNVKY